MPSRSAEKPLTHEEERQHIIEENRRRMQELGLLEPIEIFQIKRTPRKPPIRRASSNAEFSQETRRSTRAAGRPKVDYKEIKNDVGVQRTKGVRRQVLRRGYISPAAKNEAAERARDINTSHPSFVKAMLKSHTSGGFWLGLPSDFCTTNFTKDDIIVLEDEESLEWECVYLHHKHGLSGGWRGFSLDHELEDGDAVVFELVTSSRFKVYITRAAETGEPSAQKKGAVAKKREYQYVVTDSRNVHVHSALHKSLKIEKGHQFDGRKGEVCKQTTSSKTVKQNVRQSRYDSSSDESLDSDDVLEDTLEDDSPGAEGNTEGSEGADRNTEDSDQSLSSDDGGNQPTRKLKEKISRPAKRSVKSKQRLKAKTESKPLQINPGRKESSSKPAMKVVVKKNSFVRRAHNRTDMQSTKEMDAHQIELENNLPPGTRLKPVGVCSIARGSTKRKLPSMFRARKYTYFDSAKSVKVH